MSRALLAITLLAIAAVGAHAAVFQTQVFLNTDCSGTPFSVTNTTAGACTTTATGSTASYVTDATTGVAFTYNDPNCTASYAYSATQSVISSACKQSGSTASYKTVVLDISSGPQAPFSFPPAGWATTSSCKFNNGTSSPVCAASTGTDPVTCTPTAYNVGYCFKRAASGTTNVVGSSAVYCGSGAWAGGMVYFSDAACTTLVKAMLSPAGCQNGAVTSCPSNAPTLPSLPVMGVTRWDNAQCNKNAYNAPSTTLWSSACVDGQMLACSTTNSTSTATLTTYTDATNMGKCTTQVSSMSQTSDACVPSADGKSATVFSCNVNPGLSAAPAVSASVVAMIFAAILAFVAARSL